MQTKPQRYRRRPGSLSGLPAAPTDPFSLRLQGRFRPRPAEARSPGRAGERGRPGTAQVQPRYSPVTPPRPFQEVPPQPRQRLPRQPLASGRRRSSARAGRAVRREAGPGAPSLHRDRGRFPADASRSPGTSATGAGGRAPCLRHGRAGEELGNP